MKWLDRLLLTGVRNALKWENESDRMENMKIPTLSNSQIASAMQPQFFDRTTAYNFTIHKASSGFIVEFQYYNTKKDENNRRLHIITDEQDFTAELGKIVTTELLRI